jgi:tRNA A37 N6-isopentenylltransferase MiaA
MLKEGGLAEALDLFSALPSPHNFEKGILQSIGYKEFYPVFELNKRDEVLKYLQSGSAFPESKIVDQCTQRLQDKTMSYATYQLKWLRSRILRTFDSG